MVFGVFRLFNWEYYLLWCGAGRDFYTMLCYILIYLFEIPFCLLF